MRCAIWYRFYHLKNVKSTNGGMLLLVKLQQAFSLKQHSSNGEKHDFQIIQMVTNRTTHHTLI